MLTLVEVLVLWRHELYPLTGTVHDASIPVGPRDGASPDLRLDVAESWPLDLPVIRDLPRPVAVASVTDRTAAARVGRVVGVRELVALPHRILLLSDL